MNSEFKPHNGHWARETTPPHDAARPLPGANARLGLPSRDGMQKILVCFDVDGTLLAEDGGEHIPTLLLWRAFAKQPWKNVHLVVWSGGGAQYAEQKARDLGIDKLDVWRYASKLEYTKFREMGYQILAIDDIQDTALGDLNLIVRNK